MHENEKLNEARYFLARMRQATEPRIFRYELSAFMSATRSVFQYAWNEVGPNSKGKKVAKSKAKGKNSKAKRESSSQSWYQAAVSSSRLIGFFSSKRNLGVHEEPVIPSNSVTIGLSASGASAGLGNAEVATSETEAPRRNTPAENPIPSVPPWQPPVVTYEYSFPEWVGPTDAISLCEQYLTEVEAIVNDGVAKGHLTRQGHCSPQYAFAGNSATIVVSRRGRLLWSSVTIMVIPAE